MGLLGIFLEQVFWFFAGFLTTGFGVAFLAIGVGGLIWVMFRLIWPNPKVTDPREKPTPLGAVLMVVFSVLGTPMIHYGPKMFENMDMRDRGVFLSRVECEAYRNEPCWPLCCEPDFESEEARQSHIREWRERKARENAQGQGG
jgi:hypothetical protein